MKTAYFILGMHKNETSVLSGVLDIIGVDFGSGLYENTLIYKLNEKILTENNASWDDMHFNVHSLPKDVIKRYVEEAKEIISSEFQDAQNFAIKNSQICLLFPIWERACKELNIAIKTILPYGNPMGDELLLWVQCFLSAEYFSREYKRMFISFDELFTQTKKSVDELYKFIGFKGRRKRKEIDVYLDKNIINDDTLIEDFPKEIPHFLQELLAFLQAKEFNDLNAFDSIRNNFYYSQKLFQDNNLANEKLENAETLNAAQSRKIEEANEEVDELLENLVELKESKEQLSQELNEKLQNAESLNAAQSRQIEEANEEVDELLEDLVELKESKEQLSQELNEKLQNAESLNAAQSRQIEEQKQQLQEITNEKAQLQEANEAKEQEVQLLTNEVESILNDMTTIKESLSQTELNLEEQQLQNSELSEEMQTLQMQLQTQEQQLQEKEQQLQEITNEKAQLQEANEAKEQVIADLSESVDQIVSDLETIKESKCWIYTKPIRNIQKVLGK